MEMGLEREAEDRSGRTLCCKTLQLFSECIKKQSEGFCIESDMT